VDGRVLALLSFMLAACSITPRAPVAPNDTRYVWISTPRPSGDDAGRSAHFQTLVAIALAERGYRQDSSGALAIALSFSGADDPSLGAHQGGYAVFTPHTQCSAHPHRPEQPMTGCISVFHRASGQLVAPSSAPLLWNTDARAVERALGAALDAEDHAE
jgi:hypothetical protein